MRLGRNLVIIAIAVLAFACEPRPRFPRCARVRADECLSPGYCGGLSADGTFFCLEHVCDTDLDCLRDETCLGFCQPAGRTPPGAPCREANECVPGYACTWHDPRDFHATTCLPTCYTETGGWADALCAEGEICGWGGSACTLPCDPAVPTTCADGTVCTGAQCGDASVVASCIYHDDGGSDCGLGQVCHSFGIFRGFECLSPVEAAMRYPRATSWEPTP